MASPGGGSVVSVLVKVARGWDHHGLWKVAGTYTSGCSSCCRSSPRTRSRLRDALGRHALAEQPGHPGIHRSALGQGATGGPLLAASTQTLQTAIPALGTVSRLPQTTAQGAGADAGNVPFPRLSKQSQILGPQIAGVAFGTLQSPIVKAVGGYLRHIWLTVTAAGGNGGTTAAVASADAPYNTIQLFVFRDPFGQPIILSDGWGIHLINMYSGQTGMLGFGNLESALPSWSAINTGGNFNWSTLVPLELD